MPKGGNMKRITKLSLGIVGMVITGIVAVPVFAQAQGRANTNSNGGGYGYQKAIKSKAEILGLTEAELKTQLETKTMLQIAEEKGVSEDQFHGAMQKAATARWASKGLTQAEIDSRLQTMKERQAAGHEVNSVNRGGMRIHRSDR